MFLPYKIALAETKMFPPVTLLMIFVSQGACYKNAPKSVPLSLIKPFMWATGKYFILGTSYQRTDLSIEAVTLKRDVFLYKIMYQKNKTMILVFDPTYVNVVIGESMPHDKMTKSEIIRVN